MGNEVYANAMEISCKAAQGKSVCAFPDVCFTPPQTPATPPGVPIPYPNTGMASDTTEGSKSVKISGQEVMLKNKSYFKRSMGDEAGCAPKKGIITSKNMGKVYFNSWSMDVKFEGENVVRNLDLTTHNHASFPGDTPTWPYIDKVQVDNGTGPCKTDSKRERAACSKLEVDKNGKKLGKGAAKKKRCANNPDARKCRDAQKCMLQTMRPNRCCKGDQPHHLVEVHCFSKTGKRGEALHGLAGYDEAKAPCVCAKGARHQKEHGALHAVQQAIEGGYHARGDVLKTWQSGEARWTYGEAREAGVTAHSQVYPDCDPNCIRKQIENYHTQKKPDGPGVDNDTPLRTDRDASTRSRGSLNEDQQAVTDQATADAMGIGTNATS